MKMTNKERFEELMIGFMENTGQEVGLTEQVMNCIENDKVKADDLFDFIIAAGASIFEERMLEPEEVATLTGEIEDVKLGLAFSAKFIMIYFAEEEEQVKQVVNDRYVK
jgi:hypothetical protein